MLSAGFRQTANGYTAMALHDIWSGSRRNYNVLSHAIRECESHKPGLINEFNDDTLWWGLLCLHMFTIRHEQFFLEKAKEIWKHVEKQYVCRRGRVTFRDMDMEGACFWTSKDGEEQINAITTGLFAELSVRLAMVEPQHTSSHHHSLSSLFKRKEISGGEYVEAARCSLGWILRCRYRYPEHLVLDNILLQKKEARDWTFTYTTGVTLGVSALLFQQTGEVENLQLACEMAQKAIQRDIWVESNGVLTERGTYGKENHRPDQNDDAIGFKAILVRHLAILYDVIRRAGSSATPQAQKTAEHIRQFIAINMRSQLDRNTNGNGQYGPWWNGPFEMPTSHSQMAVLDLMAAAVLVNRS